MAFFRLWGCSGAFSKRSFSFHLDLAADALLHQSACQSAYFTPDLLGSVARLFELIERKLFVVYCIWLQGMFCNKKRERDMEPGLILKRQRKEILATAKRHGAYNVRVFGSVARGEARADSDVDLLVNLESGRSLLDLARLLRELESQLGCKVDIVTEAGLRPRIRQEVLREARPL
jgi:predicted nucleotidyltransferase